MGGNLRRRCAPALFVTMLLGCSTSSGSSSPPPSVQGNCEKACAPPTTGPCAGRSPPVADCLAECTRRANAFTGDCALCVSSRSGFAWRACTCDEDCNFAKDPLCVPSPIPCDECRVTVSGKSCGGQASCTGADTCLGFSFISPTEASDAGAATITKDCAGLCRL